MGIAKTDIEKLPFFNSFLSGGDSKAAIDIDDFHLWLKAVQHLDFLSELDEQDRAEAYEALKSDKALDLKEAMNEWYNMKTSTL